MRQRTAELETSPSTHNSAESLGRERDNISHILEAMEDGVCIVNQQHDIEYLNQALVTHFGSFKREKCYKYFYDRQEVCPWCQTQAIFAGRTICQERYLAKAQKTYDLIYTPLKNPDGSIAKLAIFRDITEHKRMEEELRQERNKAQKYLDLAGVMLVAIDVNHKVSLINKKGCEILGCKEEDVIGKDWFDNFLPERVRDKISAVYDKWMSGKMKRVEYFENPVLTKPHGETFIVWENTALTDENGNITGILSSGEDITKQQLLQQKMVEYEELDKLKSDLLSTVSHELRSPLAIIKGYSTMLMDYDRRITPQEKDEHLHSIDRATDRLTELVDHLLDMSLFGSRAAEDEQETL